MLTVLRNLGGWLAGVVAGGFTVALVELASHQVWPPPPDLDITDPAAIAELMATAPLGVFIALLVAWMLGGAVGSGVAAVIATWRRVLVAGMAGGMTLAGAAMNLIAIPHPLWVTLLGPVVIVLGMLGGAWVGLQVRPSTPDAG